MRSRPKIKFQPTVDPLEARQLLSATASLAHDASTPVHTHSLVADAAKKTHSTVPTKFLAFRVTNTPYQTPYPLIPPFNQVLVQSRQPVPGQVYNVLQIALKNGTAQTFNASSNFRVKLPGDRKSFPILTGDEVWKPKQVFVFYILTKKYYPLRPVAGGFMVDLGGVSSTLIPGPSAIFLRLKYNPATFAKTLDWIVAYGPGNEGGIGSTFGLPNTAINEFVAAQTNRPDFGGRF